jgi:HPt (histidine-containing phosphotransfer) domain-containing protein
VEGVGAQEARDFVEQLWVKFAPVIAERLSAIETLLDVLESGQKASPDEISNARYAAHNLAGALGSYGRPEGSTVAREIQFLLDSGAPSIGKLRPLFTALLSATSAPRNEAGA